MLPRIPPEVVEIIIDNIATDIASLRASSLVCQQFLPISRKHIFSAIAINGYSSCTTAMLRRLLIHSPHLAQYIRNLEYFILPKDFSDPPVAAVFLQLTRLRSLDVMAQIGIRISPPIRRIMLPLLHLPTLTQFRIYGISGFDVADLIPCVNLKKLDIRCVRTVEEGHSSAYDAELDSPLPCPPKQVQLEALVVGNQGFEVVRRLCTTRRPDGELVVNLSTLKSLSITYSFGEAITDDVSQELFSHCSSLTTINISLPSFQSPREFARTVEPSMHTLREIGFKTIISSQDEDPYLELICEFEGMAKHAPNNIESIRLHISIVPLQPWVQPGDRWGVLDAALTGGGWPHLRHVYLLISVHRTRFAAQLVEDMLKDLRETQFKRLSACDRVHFTFEIELAD